MLDTLFTAMIGGSRRDLDARIERLERQVALLMEVLGDELPELDTNPVAREQIQEALNRGQKIEAIKHLRTATGCGLAEAKYAIDRGTWPDLL